MLVKDAIQFIRYFASAIVQSATHLYITALTFAPKSSLIARLYAPRFKNIMHMELGKLNEWPSEQAVISGHSSDVKFVAFSPDGKRVVSSSHDMTVRVSDVETGQIVAGPFKEHTGRILCAVFSADSKDILSVSTDGTIRRWNADCGVIGGPIEHVTVTIDGINEYTDCATFSHNRKSIAFVRTWSRIHDTQIVQKVIFVQVETGQVVLDLIVGHDDRINCIVFSRDDTYLASGSDDGSIRIWDTKTGELVMGPLTGDLYSVTSISYSHDGAYIVSGSGDGTIRLWNVGGTPHQVWAYKGHITSICCLEFSGDDRWIVSGSSGRTVRVWDMETGQVVAGPLGGHTYSVLTVTFSPDSKRIASGSGDGTVCIWDVEVNATSQNLFGDQNRMIRSITLSKDSRCIVSGSVSGVIQIWDARTGQLVGGPCKVHESIVGSLAYSPDSKRIVSGSSGGAVRVLDVVTKTVTELHTSSDTGWVGSIAYSNNGKYIASAVYSQGLPVNRVWDAETNECVNISQLEAAGREMLIAFSPDDRLIVSDSRDGLGFRIWNVETGSMVIESESQTNNLQSITFSHDGKLIATGSDGIRLWDATTAKLLVGPFKGHTLSVHSVAFSSDDALIVSGSWDRTIRVWLAKTGQCIMGPFHGHTETIYSVSFTHDNKNIISGSDDGTIRIWSMERTQWSLFTDQSEIDGDGWMRGLDGELLFWVPLRHRANLHRPGNTWTIGPYSTRLNFGNARWGKDWTQCYTP